MSQNPSDALHQTPDVVKSRLWCWVLIKKKKPHWCLNVVRNRKWFSFISGEVRVRNLAGEQDWFRDMKYQIFDKKVNKVSGYDGWEESQHGLPLVNEVTERNVCRMENQSIDLKIYYTEMNSDKVMV